ncbi:hypothetical protein FJTKL_14220 [Diaporthe vaccinii]|uniref:Uncharacterized protein n=1 Tax=Diaporthe vaccinii TaxID=105482 RepID=A0ABR4E8T8_9PEZI
MHRRCCAQGGNGALETAAVLLNALVRKLDESAALSEDDIGAVFAEAVFAEAQARRLARAGSSLEQGRRTSSVSMRDTLPSRLFVHCLLPWFGDRIIVWLAVRHAETGPVVDGLPLPSRHGVTLPHASTVKKPRGGKVLWGLRAIGVALVVVLLYSSGSRGRPDSLAMLFSHL